MKNYQASRWRYRAVTLYSGATLVSCFAAAAIVACALGLLPDVIAEGAVAFAILAVSASLIVYRARASSAGEEGLPSPTTLARESRPVRECLATQLVKAQLVNPAFGGCPADVDGCRSERIRVLQSWPVEGDNPTNARRRYLVAVNIDNSLRTRGGAPVGTCRLPVGLPFMATCIDADDPFPLSHSAP